MVDVVARFGDDAGVAESQEEFWVRVRGQLEAARAQLTNAEDPALSMYEHFAIQNELGLALDALADVAAAQRAPGDVWRTLGQVVELMGLDPGDDVHGGTVVRILEHLQSAHDWRGLQRLLNEWDPIGVRPDLGGPDDEYSCMYVPLMGRLASGGDVSEVSLFLRADLGDHFGLEPEYSEPDAFAQLLVDWYRTGRQ